MEEATKDRIAAFEAHMNVSPSKLAREEYEAGKRWTLLEAAAFLATGDEKMVVQVRTWCPPFNALPHHQAALAASVHLTRALDERQASDPNSFSYEGALRILLDALRSGEMTAYVNAKPTSLKGIDFRDITYSADMTGLSPTPPNDSRFWGSVHANAADVRRVRLRLIDSPATTADRVAVVTGAKRGPKPKWDWFNLMGELVRIADEDGLASLGSQSDVERWASTWLAQRAGGDAEPAESLVRDHIAPIFDAIERHNAEKARGTK